MCQVYVCKPCKHLGALLQCVLVHCVFYYILIELEQIYHGKSAQPLIRGTNCYKQMIH